MVPRKRHKVRKECLSAWKGRICTCVPQAWTQVWHGDGRQGLADDLVG